MSVEVGQLERRELRADCDTADLRLGMDDPRQKAHGGQLLRQREDVRPDRVERGVERVRELPGDLLEARASVEAVPHDRADVVECVEDARRAVDEQHLPTDLSL